MKVLGTSSIEKEGYHCYKYNDVHVNGLTCNFTA